MDALLARTKELSQRSGHAILMASPIFRIKNAQRPSTTFRSFPLSQSSDTTIPSCSWPSGDLVLASLLAVSTRTVAWNNGVCETCAAGHCVLFRLAARVHVMLRGAMLHLRPLGVFPFSCCRPSMSGCEEPSIPAARRALMTYSTTTSKESNFFTLSRGRYVQVLGGGRYVAMEGDDVLVMAYKRGQLCHREGCQLTSGKRISANDHPMTHRVVCACRIPRRM